MIALLALLGAVTAPDVSSPTGSWGEFSAKPSLSWITTVIQIGTLDARPDHSLNYWMRMTHRADASHSTDDDGVWWADSRSRPAIRNIVAGMTSFSMLQIDPPGDNLIHGIEADGTTYRLRAPIKSGSRIHGELTIESNVGTPLASWVDESLRTLSSCWSRTPPPRYRG